MMERKLEEGTKCSSEKRFLLIVDYRDSMVDCARYSIPPQARQQLVYKLTKLKPLLSTRSVCDK